MRNPRTPAEWQEAVDAAAFYRLVHDAKLYGLITGPKVNAARCDEILTRGKKLGILPAPIDQLIVRFLEPTHNPTPGAATDGGARRSKS